jgi:hypothetical protein
MTDLEFHTTVLQTGRNTTGIAVPAEIVEALGGGKRPAVHVRLNDYAYRSTVAPMGGVFMIPVSADVRAASGVAGGDSVEVGLALDTEPRTVEVPDDLADALAQAPGAREFFDGLSHTHRKWHCDQVTGAKTAETRQRRVEKSVALLASGRLARFRRDPRIHAKPDRDRNYDCAANHSKRNGGTVRPPARPSRTAASCVNSDYSIYSIYSV